MARKYVRGYTIEDLKYGMKLKDKDDDEHYLIIKNLDDVHNVFVYIYDLKGKKRGTGFYCFDKNCELEYCGGKVEIVS